MAKLNQHSFERLFDVFVLISSCLLLALLVTIGVITEATLLEVVTVFLVLVLPYVFLAWRVKEAIRTPLMGLSASIEAIRNEDYSLRAKPKFQSGAIKLLGDEVNLMAEDLRIRKLHYDQQAVLVLNLIEQLATPIAVFDQNGRLNHANDAFSIWCGRPWRQAKQQSCKSLGLEFTDDSNWRVIDSDNAQLWQLRHSGFSMLGEDYQLVVLTNIEKIVNETERLAWHKMTRVLSHEINNSLSPIKSLAQSLAEVFASVITNEAESQQALEALEVIASRSDNLMQFVNRYASLNQRFEINLQPVSVQRLADKVKALFDHPIVIEKADREVNADAVLLEQVLINLIKNAVEASPPGSEITISCTNFGKYIDIQVMDQGSGIANPDNLFVPFYTTKDQGKGIGLALSRNMIEQQGGRLRLQNTPNGKGATASIRLNAVKTQY